MNYPKKILLADDDQDDRMLFEIAYKDRTDIILLPPALNGLEVIDQMNAWMLNGDFPDLIILDQNMPRMTGKQTLLVLKRNEIFSSIPVCICSTYADPQLTTDCLRLGAYRVSSKPITQDEYQKMMDEFLTVFDGE